VLPSQTHGCDEPDFNRYVAYCATSPGERQLLDDLTDHKLDSHTLFEAALTIAGHDRAELARYKTQLKSSIRRCGQKLEANDSQDKRLRIIFRHLSTEFLYGNYKPDLYDVGRTMSAGEFNCLTATILFQSLCKAFSSEIQAVWEPAHVQCWWPATRTYGHLIETTSASATSAIGPLSSASGLSGRRISKSELIGKVFYNKGVSSLKAQEFATALAATWTSCLLDPKDSPAQSNLRACINNWALSASDEDDFKLAQQLLEEGLKLDPNYEPFSRNKALLLER
jgi:hypothetical protein